MNIGFKSAIYTLLLFAVFCADCCSKREERSVVDIVGGAIGGLLGEKNKIEINIDPKGTNIFNGIKLNKLPKLANQNVLTWRGKTIIAIGTSAKDPPEITKIVSDALKKIPMVGKSCRIKPPRLPVPAIHEGPKAEGALLTDFEPCAERKRAAKSGKNKPSKSSSKSSGKRFIRSRATRSESYSARNWLWNDPENIPLVYDSSFPKDQKDNAKMARELWENYTCIKFAEQDKPSANQSYALLTSGGGACTTDRLGPNFYDPFMTKVDATTCTNLTGSLAHELGHVLGLTHSQSRVDRDNYLTFFSDNVADNWKSQFDVDDIKYYSPWGVPFYYDSIMEYYPYAATVNSLMTLCPLDPLMETLMGQRIEPVLGDYSVINRIYCQESCFNKSSMTDSFGGSLSMTIGGRTCQPWSSQTPHAHAYGYVGDHNFCRNPDKWAGGPWCYTTDSSITYEPCFSACEDLAARNKPYCEGWCYNGGYHNPDTCDCVCPAFASGKYCGKVNDSLRYTHLTCGGKVNLTVGQKYVINSPNYPKNYSNSQICIWWLMAPKNAKVKLTVNDFDVEASDQTGCYDYLEIRRSLCAPAIRLPETMRYCGNSLNPDPAAGPHEILSDDSNMILKFMTDDKDNGRGFSILATVPAT